MKVSETTELDWNWRTWNFSMTRGSTNAVNYANLTRGVKCAPRNSHLIRIQSTQCEAGQWERLLLGIPDEFLARVAVGQYITVHDFSEKNRETRAMWQGLTLTRIMIEYRWFGELRSRFNIKRGGKSAVQYLRNVAATQPEHVRRKYDYFRDLAMESNTTYTSINSCWQVNGGRNCAVRGETNTPNPTVDRPPSNLW
jgi:hypothetical protein